MGVAKMHEIVVAGGDSRDIWICRMLLERGHQVRVWGIEARDIPAFVPGQDNFDVFIGPMTGIDKYGRIAARDATVYLTEQLLGQMRDGGLVAAGLIAPDVSAQCQALGIATVQYRLENTFMWLNTVPTAEGALQAAIGRSGQLLFARPIGIIGFGRVGLVLADRLRKYGAQPIIFERLAEKRAMAQALGHPAWPLQVMPRPTLDGLFNTAPAPVLDESWFASDGPPWIIDLASIPGGLANSLKDEPSVYERYQQILSIPGKVAPIRAAEIIWETLRLALKEE